MMFSVYVLYSDKAKRLYIGYTSDFVRRFREHNDLSKGIGNKFTLRNGPWRLIHIEDELSSRSEAMKRETFLKPGAGRQWIKGHFTK